MTGRRPGPAPGNSLEDRFAQRAAAEKRRQSLLDLMRTRDQKASDSQPVNDRVQRSTEQSLSAIDGLRLYSVGDTASLRRLSLEYRSLIEAAVEVMNRGGELVLLCWPPRHVCLPAIVNLLALADLAGARQTTVSKESKRVDIIAEKPLGMRAIIFPYSRTSRGPAREIQIDKRQLAEVQIRHLLRCMDNKDPPALKDYHTVLSRVRGLTGKGRDGRSYPEFEHPVLDEIVPHGTATNGCAEHGELLWRTKSKTDLKELSRTGHADKPDQAVFFLYQLRPNDNLARELKKVGAAPDLILLDLCRSARGRLGRDWISNARKAVDAMRAAFPDTGILAVTDDPWSCDAARFEVLGTRQPNGVTKMRPAPSRVLYGDESGILGDGSAAPMQWVGGTSVVADGFTGNLEGTVARLRALGKLLADRGNPTASDSLREIITKVRRSACLPGSLAEFSAFLEREHADSAAADTMTGYRIDGNLSLLHDPRQGAFQVSAKDMSTAESDALSLIRASEKATPMASLLEASLTPIIRSSSRTVVVLRNELIADFTADRLSQKFDKLEGRIEADMVRFTTRQGLADLAGVAPSYRSQFKRAFIVAPTRQSILEILSQPWLPDEVLFLADSDTLRFAARDAGRLASQLDQIGLKTRLTQFAGAAGQRLQQIGDHAVALDSMVPPSDDVDFPFGTVVDLVGSQRGDRRVVELEMASGQRILARPRTGLVQRDNSRSVRRFIEVPAGEVSVGDEICVISTGFIEKARSLINIAAAAAEEIRDYHTLVLKRFAALPGANDATRLRELCQRMGEPAVRTATASYWIRLDEEQAKPLHEVVPHAPQDRDTFMRFTGALDISKPLASRFWAWAVLAQRSSKMRAGAAFHDAYKGILTDEHSALAANKDRAAEIRALRAAADEYVSTVAVTKTRGGS